MILTWLAQLLSSPVVAGVLIPSLSRALTTFLERQATRIALQGAIKQAKAAKTAEDLRNASKRLSDATLRR